MTKKEWLYWYLSNNHISNVTNSISLGMKPETEWFTYEEIVRESWEAAKRGEIDSPILMRASKNSHDRSIEVYNLVREINEDDAYSIVIMQKGAKFAFPTSKKEALEYLEGSLKKRALTALKRYWQQYRKVCEDGQFDIFVQDFIKGVAK